MKTQAPVLFFLTLLLTLVGTQAVLAEPKTTIKIGAIIPLTGGAETYGKEVRLGLEQALADAPKNKFNYELIIEDDQLTSTGAVSAAQKLLSNNQVDVLLSNWSYGGVPVSSAVKGKDVSHFAFAWSPTILSAAKNSYLHAPPPNSLAEKLIAQLQIEKAKKIVLIHYEEAGTEHAINLVEKAAQVAKIQVLKRIRISPNDSQVLKSITLQLKQLQPDFLVGVLLQAQNLELFKNLKSLNYNLPYACLGVCDLPSKEYAKLAPDKWWMVDYLANPSDQQKIQQRTGLIDITGYVAFYDLITALIAIYETAPDAKTARPSWLQEQLLNYESSTSYLGKFYFKDRIRQSDAARIIDNKAKYQ